MIRNEERFTGLTRPSFKAFQGLNISNPLAAEIGVWRGENAAEMLNVDLELKLWAIDSYANLEAHDSYVSLANIDGLIKLADYTLEPYEDRVVKVRKNSEDAVGDFKDGFFDYVYIDGDHTYEPVLRDCRLWWPKVKAGGMLAGHDITMDSVKGAVEKFALENNLKVCINAEGKGGIDWWIFR